MAKKGRSGIRRVVGQDRFKKNELKSPLSAPHHGPTSALRPAPLNLSGCSIEIHELTGEFLVARIEVLARIHTVTHVRAGGESDANYHEHTIGIRF